MAAGCFGPPSAKICIPGCMDASGCLAAGLNRDTVAGLRVPHA
jgi:hypothetical protein